jgi:hypothetical protein
MDGLPRLVDVSCEVGDRQCRDILCLIQWVGVRHGVGPSSVRDRLEMENRGLSTRRTTGGDRSYPVDDYWTPSSDVHDSCGKGSAGLIRRRCVYGGSLAAHTL